MSHVHSWLNHMFYLQAERCQEKDFKSCDKIFFNTFFGLFCIKVNSRCEKVKIQFFITQLCLLQAIISCILENGSIHPCRARLMGSTF